MHAAAQLEFVQGCDLLVNLVLVIIKPHFINHIV
jgi:hypothetical protein